MTSLLAEKMENDSMAELDKVLNFTRKKKHSLICYKLQKEEKHFFFKIFSLDTVHWILSSLISYFEIKCL